MDESRAPIVRATRVAPTTDVAARLGTEFGHVVNVSATGALVRTRMPFLVGRQCPLVLHVIDAPTTLFVRIVRTDHITVSLPDAVWQTREYGVAVNFLGLPPTAKRVVATLCGGAFVQTE